MPCSSNTTRHLLISFFRCAVISSGVWLTFAIGRINIAQGAFCMIGGYATAILTTRYGVSFWLSLPLSALVAAAFGALIGTADAQIRATPAMAPQVVRQRVLMLVMPTSASAASAANTSSPDW